MPSVTDTMVPTLRASVTPLKFSMRCLMRSLISVALMAMLRIPWEFRMCGRSSRDQFVGDALQAPAHRAIDDQITGTQHGAAEQLRIDAAMQAHLALEASAQGCGQGLLLPGIQRGCRGHRDIGDALGVVLVGIE